MLSLLFLVNCSSTVDPGFKKILFSIFRQVNLYIETNANRTGNFIFWNSPGGTEWKFLECSGYSIRGLKKLNFSFGGWIKMCSSFIWAKLVGSSEARRVHLLVIHRKFLKMYHCHCFTCNVYIYIVVHNYLSVAESLCEQGII